MNEYDLIFFTITLYDYTTVSESRADHACSKRNSGQARKDAVPEKQAGQVGNSIYHHEIRRQAATPNPATVVVEVL